MNTDDLLLQVAVAPDDDDVKRVFADALLAEGKPWGEFISLQLAKTRAPATIKREKELLAVAWHWLPEAMKRVVSPRGLRFEKGFLSQCSIIGSQEQCAAAAFHPLWTSVKAMHGGTLPLVLGCPSLKHWTGVARETLPSEVGEVPKLDVLGVYWGRRDTEERLGSFISSAVRVGLSELHVTSRDHEGWWPCDCCPQESQNPYPGPFQAADIVRWARVGMIPRTLRIYNGFTELLRLRDHLANEGVEVKSLAIRSSLDGSARLRSDWDLELCSVKAGDFRAARIAHVPSEAGCDDEPPLDLHLMLTRLPARFFSSLTLVGSGWTKIRRLPCFDGATLSREEQR